MYYSHPPVITALEEFSSLPKRFRNMRENSWAEANFGGRPCDSFLEGPVFDAVGNLYVCDIPFGRIFRIDAQGQWTLIIEYDGQPNGMKFLSPKEVLITDYQKGLLVLDIESKGDRSSLRPFLTHKNSESFKGLNDLFIASNGDVYFTDQGQTGLHDATGRVYRKSKDGRLDLLLSNVPSPNGIVLSLDEKVLFVAATRGNCVWRAPIMRDGSVSKVGQFFTSHGPSGPDGLAMDPHGRLLVANPGLGVVWVLNALAEPVQILKSASPTSITNLALKNGDTVYCTDSGSGRIMTAKLMSA